MEYYYLGYHTTNHQHQLHYHQQGIHYAQQCNTLTKNQRVECLFWYATNLALYSQSKGLFSIAFKIRDIISYFAKAEQINNRYIGAGPTRMQAIFYFKAPSLLGGDKQKAYQKIKRSIQLVKNEPLNYHWYIQFLLDDQKKQLAKKIAKQAIKIIDPTKIKFYESQGAFQDILHFHKTGEFIP